MLNILYIGEISSQRPRELELRGSDDLGNFAGWDEANRTFAAIQSLNFEIRTVVFAVFTKYICSM